MTQQTWMTNRDKKRQPKQGKFWCDVCDACLVHEGERCPVCKNWNGKRRRNKR